MRCPISEVESHYLPFFKMFWCENGCILSWFYHWSQHVIYFFVSELLAAAGATFLTWTWCNTTVLFTSKIKTIHSNCRWLEAIPGHCAYFHMLGAICQHIPTFMHCPSSSSCLAPHPIVLIDEAGMILEEHLLYNTPLAGTRAPQFLLF